MHKINVLNIRILGQRSNTNAVNTRSRINIYVLVMDLKSYFE